VLGNETALISARSTAAIADAIVNGSLIALNRNGDPSGVGGSTDISKTGTAGGITAGGPVIMASNNNPLSVTGHPPMPSLIVQNGTTLPSGYSATQMPDGPIFNDPMAGKGQPPLPSANLTPRPVPGGSINNTTPGCTSGVCSPGLYFATSTSGCPSGYSVCASGAPLTVSSNISGFSGGSFGNFIFFGGMSISNTVNFGAGLYAMAGAQSGNHVLDISGTLTGGSGTDAGRLVILTDSTYPGLSSQLSQISIYAPPALGFGDMSVDNHDTISLYGLDRTQTLPTNQNTYGYELSDFAPAVIWQDQRNSLVSYNANGTICTSGCTSSGATATTATITMKHANVTLQGMLYQPRGAQLSLHFGEDSWTAGPQGIELITGSIDIGGSTSINLGGPNTTSPPLTRITALVE
jgi:hypothetical protein